MQVGTGSMESATQLMKCEVSHLLLGRERSDMHLISHSVEVLKSTNSLGVLVRVLVRAAHMIGKNGMSLIRRQ